MFYIDFLFVLLFLFHLHPLVVRLVSHQVICSLLQLGFRLLQFYFLHLDLLMQLMAQYLARYYSVFAHCQLLLLINRFHGGLSQHITLLDNFLLCQFKHLSFLLLVFESYLLEHGLPVQFLGQILLHLLVTMTFHNSLDKPCFDDLFLTLRQLLKRTFFKLRMLSAPADYTRLFIAFHSTVSFRLIHRQVLFYKRDV